mmetsp:Transcript_95162/g.293430  ORF Transcript_95162/g.293430 Transcript_95162/m.293430 type:complete len:286 (-) Transcript_95162:1660-2517(-)
MSTRATWEASTCGGGQTVGGGWPSTAVSEKWPQRSPCALQTFTSLLSPTLTIVGRGPTAVSIATPQLCARHASGVRRAKGGFRSSSLSGSDNVLPPMSVPRVPVVFMNSNCLNIEPLVVCLSADRRNRLCFLMGFSGMGRLSDSSSEAAMEPLMSTHQIQPLLSATKGKRLPSTSTGRRRPAGGVCGHARSLSRTAGSAYARPELSSPSSPSGSAGRPGLSAGPSAGRAMGPSTTAKAPSRTTPGGGGSSSVSPRSLCPHCQMPSSPLLPSEALLPSRGWAARNW